MIELSKDFKESYVDLAVNKNLIYWEMIELIIWCFLFLYKKLKIPYSFAGPNDECSTIQNLISKIKIIAKCYFEYLTDRDTCQESYNSINTSKC